MYTDDVIGCVFPIYGCTVPKYVKTFLENVKFDANYTFAIGTYGMSHGKTMEIAQNIAKDNGYRFDYVNTVLMLDNCQPQFDIAKEKEKLPDKKVDEQIVKIKKEIENRKRVTYKSSLTDKAGTWVCSTLFNVESDDYAKHYSVDNSCIKCGICKKVCPMANIEITDKVEFLNHCACCQACIHACPKHAIHYKGERNTERWRNENVTLPELIKSNNQEKKMQTVQTISFC